MYAPGEPFRERSGLRRGGGSCPPAQMSIPSVRRNFMPSLNLRKTQYEQMSSSLPPKTDIPERGSRDRPLCAAGSTGRRNTGIKSLCWGFKLQGLTWPFVELTSHFVQIGLRMHRQVSALRKVLSQQTIDVLIRAALPWVLRIAKINVDVCRQREPSMVRKFLTPVPGQRFIQLAR